MGTNFGEGKELNKLQNASRGSGGGFAFGLLLCLRTGTLGRRQQAAPEKEFGLRFPDNFELDPNAGSGYGESAVAKR